MPGRSTPMIRSPSRSANARASTGIWRRAPGVPCIQITASPARRAELGEAQPSPVADRDGALQPRPGHLGHARNRRMERVLVYPWCGVCTLASGHDGMHVRSGGIRVGISGWRYAGWRGDFYPNGLAQRRELEYAAERLTSIEINGSFYSLQRPSSYALVARGDPRRLRVRGQGRPVHHPHEAAGRTWRRRWRTSSPRACSRSGRSSGRCCGSCRRRCASTPTCSTRFFALLPRTTSEAASLAERHDDKVGGPVADHDRGRPAAAPRAGVPQHDVRAPTRPTTSCAGTASRCVLADTAGRWPKVEQVTSDFVYVRLHGDEELYASGYSDDGPRRVGRRSAAAGRRRARRVRLLRQRHEGLRAARRDAADRAAVLAAHAG